MQDVGGLHRGERKARQRLEANLRVAFMGREGASGGHDLRGHILLHDVPLVVASHSPTRRQPSSKPTVAETPNSFWSERGLQQAHRTSPSRNLLLIQKSGAP